jgi:hypothetical protein
LSVRSIPLIVPLLQVYIYRSIDLCVVKLYGQPLTSLADFRYILGSCQTLKGIDSIVLVSLSISFGMAVYKLMHIVDLPRVWQHGKLLRLLSRRRSSQDLTPMHSWSVKEVILWLSHNLPKRDLKHTASIVEDVSLDGQSLADITEIQLIAFGIRAPCAALICDERSSTLRVLAQMQRQSTMMLSQKSASAEQLSDEDLFAVFSERMKEDQARRHVQLPLFGRVRVPSVANPRSLSFASRSSRGSRGERSSRGSRGAAQERLGEAMATGSLPSSERSASREPARARIAFDRSLDAVAEDNPRLAHADDAVHREGSVSMRDAHPRDQRRRMREEKLQFGVA